MPRLSGDRSISSSMAIHCKWHTTVSPGEPSVNDRVTVGVYIRTLDC